MSNSSLDSATNGEGAPGGASAASDSRVWRGRFLVGVLGLCVLGGVLRFLILTDYLANNPLSACPTVDSLTYWRWAGRVAAGQLSDATPYFSAPLYPHLLGVLRACGGGLKSAYVAQILLDLVTAVLLAYVARRRFGAVVGLLAAGMFLAMFEPASYSLRVLNGSLQLFLTVVAWTLLAAIDRRPSFVRAAAAGGSLGLLALAYPPAVLAAPVVALWIWGRGGWRGRALGRAALALIVWAAVISPATIHNYRACGEFIPISAQAGLTFAHGNAPGAAGTYMRQPGVSIHQNTQNADALRVYTNATGREPSWNGVNRYFFARGLAYWRDNPRQALALLARKAYWFLTGRNYGDIFRPTMEISEGLTSRLRLAPIHTAWLIPLALAALGAWLVRPGDRLPELLLFGVPLLVVIAFWYSPRYRLPTIPVIAVASAWTLSRALAARRRWRWRAVAGVGVLLGVGLGLVNQAVGFDSRDAGRPKFHNSLGAALANSGRLEQAAEHFRKALELAPGCVEYAVDLGNVLSALGDPGAALPYLRRAAAAHPGDAYAHDALGRALSLGGRHDQALAHLRRAVALNPRDPRLHNNLGDELRFHGKLDAAVAEHRAAISLDRTFANAYFGLARTQRARGDVSGVIAARRALLGLFPHDGAIALRLAWDLATLPGLTKEQHAEAARLAAQTLARGPSPRRFEALAAAQAALGDFESAVEAQKRAVALAEKVGLPEKVAGLKARLRLYANRRPYVQRIGRSNRPAAPKRGGP